MGSSVLALALRTSIAIIDYGHQDEVASKAQ